jgi:hypothetical protein
MLKGGYMNNEKKHLIFLENFISKHYSKQPKWVRTIVFILLTILLVYSTYRITGGEYSVRGSILLQENQQDYKPVGNYDVQVDDKNFGTNSQGFYYVILGPIQYSRLNIGGELDTVLINKDDNTFSPQILEFNRLNQEFERLTLPKQKANRSAEYQESEGAFLDIFINSASAANGIQNGDRLFVTAITLNPDSPKIIEVELEAMIENNTFKLLSTQTGGLPTGLVPVISGKTVNLEKKYYFNIPRSLDSSLLGDIRLSEKKGIISKLISSSYSETFKIFINQSYGKLFTAKGNKGSQIDMLLLSKYDVVIWEKYDIENVIKDLETEFTQSGFRVVKKRSPLGSKSQTNALYGGESVPFTTMQQILRILDNRQIKIKTIQYQLNLRSGNYNEIQVGGSARLNDAPPIPDKLIKKILNTQDEKEFMNLKNLK